MSGLLIALGIGAAFGWTLESAGLGDPPKLAGQFYLRDFTVVKVMMSAMLTAMLGSFWLGWLGAIDLGAVYVPETYLLPQLVGGLIFGLGFVLSGLCPGTACVALASGRRAGAATIAGLFGGVLLTGLSFPLIQSFYNATPQGALTLPQLLDAPYGAVVAAITLAAVGMLAGIARWEALR